MSSKFDTGVAAADGASPGVRNGQSRRGQTSVDRPANLAADERELRLMLDPVAGAAAQARVAMWEWQAAFALEVGFMEDTLVVVSELVSNAVRHANSPHEIIATLTDDVVRIEVHDLLADPPVLRVRDGRNHGYGLRLVAELTDRWGWRPTTTGKYVWTETQLQPFGSDGHGATPPTWARPP